MVFMYLTSFSGSQSHSKLLLLARHWDTVFSPVQILQGHLVKIFRNMSRFCFSANCALPPSLFLACVVKHCLLFFFRGTNNSLTFSLFPFPLLLRPPAFISTAFIAVLPFLSVRGVVVVFAAGRLFLLGVQLRFAFHLIILPADLSVHLSLLSS